MDVRVARGSVHQKGHVPGVRSPVTVRHVETFEAAADGESHPISSDTAASCRLAGDGLQMTFKGPAGQSDTQRCILSADQKQMTCSGVLTGGDGETVHYVDVYDRM